MFDAIMSDLALENFGIESASRIRFPTPSECEMMGFPLFHASRDGQAYHTVICRKIWLGDSEERQRLCKLLCEIIAGYLPHSKPCVLTVGLGSTSVTADSLGPLTVDRVLVTDSVMQDCGMPKICAVKPGVPARTGLDTAATVRTLAEQSGAELIITVDSLGAVSAQRLCTVVQITDCGITPGSALSHSSGEISRATMPCPVISIGVPTVIRADVLSGNECDKGLLVSPTDTDIALDCYASVIAGAINLALLGNNAK